MQRLEADAISLDVGLVFKKPEPVIPVPTCAADIAIRPAAEAAPAINSEVAAPLKPRIDAIDTKAPVMTSPSPLAAQPQKAAQTETVSLAFLGADVMAVAMRILQGDLKSMPVSAEMVGSTLVVGAEAWIVAGAFSVSPKNQDLTPAKISSGTKVAAICGLTVIDADVLSIAMRIISGELRQIKITEEMAGHTLVLGQEAWVIDAGRQPEAASTAPAAPSLSATSLTLASQPTLSTAEGENPPIGRAGVSAMILDVMQLFKTEWLSVTKISALLDGDTGYKTDASLNDCVRKCLEVMIKQGVMLQEVVTTEGRQVKSFRLAD